MAEVVLPGSLLELFPGAPRRVQVAGGTVREVIDGLDERWPGMRNRLCDAGPALRRHIIVFVDTERADLDGAVAPASQMSIVPALSGG